MEVSGQHHAPPAVPTRKNCGTRRKGVRVGLQEFRTFWGRAKSLAPAGSRNPGQSIPYPSHYTNRATPAPCKSRVLTQTSDNLSPNPSCLTKCWHNTHLQAAARLRSTFFWHIVPRQWMTDNRRSETSTSSHLQGSKRPKDVFLLFP